jgi:hypothetical protein
VEGTVGSMMDDLARRAGVTIQRTGALDLIPAAGASAFVNASSEAGVRILGIEGFKIIDGDARPDMTAIADFSDIRGEPASNAEAVAFMKSLNDPELMFEFTLDEKGAL